MCKYGLLYYIYILYFLVNPVRELKFTAWIYRILVPNSFITIFFAASNRTLLLLSMDY
jgi:hypothetical protein